MSQRYRWLEKTMRTFYVQKYLWRYYYPNIDVLIFVVDSNDRERMEEVKTELGRLVREDELKDCSLLVMANKQDLPNAMSVQEMSTNLDLTKLPCSWYIQDCCATNGEGLLEGLGWVKTQLKSPKQINRGQPQAAPAEGDPREHKEPRNKLHSSWLSFSNYLTRGGGGANSTETYQRL
ncbi:ADP-ribosylation factor 1 [Geodia barretti]|uniref:ADP-ribosylation factor 1 n=1 Tax=Geodia barretti TaxID=519541 RepID=A0AA35R7H1_GEOBA|nr:ADP-ribosylation factor 1 [Geodia barretti]